jgi:predicted peptidase
MKTGVLMVMGWALIMGQMCAAEWQEAFEKKVAESGAVEVPYRLATLGEGRLPLVLFLHGAGERGNDNEAQLRHGMKDLLAWCRENKQSCHILAPQCARGGWWSNMEGDFRGKEGMILRDQPGEAMAVVLGVIDGLVEAGEVDPDRVYITGLSMGGFGTFDAISRRPEFFAAAVPVCGGGDPKQAVKFKDLPLWVFHGAKDSVVQEVLSAQMVAAVKEAGGTPKYTVYPEANHDSWSATYADGRVWKWLFAQRKK